MGLIKNSIAQQILFLNKQALERKTDNKKKKRKKRTTKNELEWKIGVEGSGLEKKKQIHGCDPS